MQTNILSASQGSIRSAALGVKSYIRFCDAMGLHAFPTAKVTVHRWSATFGAGKTYGLYVNIRKKADLLLGNEPTWSNAEIRTIDNAMADVPDKSLEFPNFASPKTSLGSRNPRTARTSPGRITYPTSPRSTWGNRPAEKIAISRPTPEIRTG